MNNLITQSDSFQTDSCLYKSLENRESSDYSLVSFLNGSLSQIFIDPKQQKNKADITTSLRLS